jgi:ABC-type multidrug transport system ATPase subunit
MNLAIETRGLRRTFGDFVAVDGVDLRVRAGCLYGFLGPNGAGKSTTLKCLTGLLSPSAGTISILGLDPKSEGVEIRRRRCSLSSAGSMAWTLPPSAPVPTSSSH